MSSRTTWNPSSPGIWMSRKRRSGDISRASSTAWTPFDACPTISISGKDARRKQSSSRASCSSSATRARTDTLSTRAEIGNVHVGDLHPGDGPALGIALELELVLGPVDDLEPLVHVGEPDPKAALGALLLREADAVVFDLDDRASEPSPRTDDDAPPFEPRAHSMLHRVLHQRLDDHRGDVGFEGVVVDLLLHQELPASEADGLDVEVGVDELQLLLEGDEVILFLEELSQDARELSDEHPGHFGIGPRRGRDGVEGVEKEVRVDLARERLESRADHQNLLLRELLLEPDVVPDLQRDPEGGEGADVDGEKDPGIFRGEMKDEVRSLGADEDTEGLERDRHRKDRDLPVEHPFPDRGLSDADEVQEDERREAPDIFLSAEVAHDPAAHAVDHSEGKGE